MNLAENLARVKERVHEACVAAGRRPEDVTVIAVSKRNPAEAIDAVVAAGHSEFGENYVQEALDKFPRAGANLHFIGALQRNKVRKIIGISHLIHGVGSLSVMEALDRIAAEEGRVCEFLLQLHLTSEETKSGIEPKELAVFLERAAGLSHARLRGFMAMAPLLGGSEAAERTFAHAQKLLHASQGRLPYLNILSMGMSGDLEPAIAHGATHVRVGTAIFGQRDLLA